MGPIPPGLTLADVPDEALIHRYDPRNEAAFLYRSTADGRAYIQRVLVVDEDVILGRATTPE
jgi:hypothetical protein